MFAFLLGTPSRTNAGFTHLYGSYVKEENVATR